MVGWVFVGAFWVAVQCVSLVGFDVVVFGVLVFASLGYLWWLCGLWLLDLGGLWWLFAMGFVGL